MPSQELRCSICRTPWHPATGHLLSERMRWCWSCTRSWVKELVGMQKRRCRGLRFYDHATVPGPAETLFEFHVDVFAPVDDRGTFDILALRAWGRTVGDAYTQVKGDIPAGHRVWSYITRE